jgi:hypothetical protein
VKNFCFATAALLLLSATVFGTTMTITTPSNGATVSTAMHVTAASDNGSPIYAYVDNNLVYKIQSRQLDTTLNVSTGQHHLVLVTWDAVGNSYTAERYVTASSTAPAPSSGIAISSPASGATVASPVHFALTAANAQTIYIYVDDQLLYRVNSTQVDTSLPLSAGSHYVVVQSWDSAGNLSRVTENINVSGTSSPAPTPTPTPNSGITVSSPSNGATVASPVQISASAANSVAMQVYVDDQLSYRVSNGSVNTSLAMSSGAHYLVVQSWDQAGNVTKSPLNITVSGGSGGGSGGGPSIPSNASVYKDIDQVSGWDSCSACAGEGGSGPVVAYSATQGRSSPSMDGASMQFWLGGSTPWGAALWWKELTPQPSAKHYVYDLYFYYTDQYAPQALEFDMNVTANGNRYIFGTQCDIGGAQVWDTWNNPGHTWQHTSAACPAPPVNTWNHLVWEYQRNDDGSMTFVAVTLNGNRHAVNVTTWPTSQSGDELNVAFQMDGNFQEANYSVWLDKVQLSAW